MSPTLAWRMLPPAGAPLTARTLFSGLASLTAGNSREEALRRALAARFGVRHVRLADTGRAALALALTALARIRPGRDEVLIPAYVSFSVPSAVVNAGLKVRLYDVLPGDLTPDYETMRRAASERTLAVVICHQFGLPFDPAPASAVCRGCGAALVDDAAQAMGGAVNGGQAGCLGDIGLFSLSRGKPLTAVEGGILLTNDEAIARAIDGIATAGRNATGDAANVVKATALLFLRRPAFYRLPASLPWLNIGASVFDPSFRGGPISRFRAGLALSALSMLDAANAARRRTAERYCRELGALPFARAVPPQPGSAPVYLRFPILPVPGGAERLRALMRAGNGMQARRLGISQGFPLALDAVPALRPHLAGPSFALPGATLLAENLVTLPTHDQVREKDVKAVIRFLAEGQGRAGQ